MSSMCDQQKLFEIIGLAVFAMLLRSFQHHMDESGLLQPLLSGLQQPTSPP